MLSYQATGQRPRFSTVLSAFACDDGLPFADVLTEEHIQQACDDHGVHFGADDDDVWTPALTLWTFLSQCLSAGKSCVAAVARAVVLRVALGLPPCSANTGSSASRAAWIRWRPSAGRCCACQGRCAANCCGRCWGRWPRTASATGRAGWSRARSSDDVRSD